MMRFPHSCARSPHIALSYAKPIRRWFEHITENAMMIAQPQLKELLLQSLEHEHGGVMLYQTALECVINDDLREEWEKYLEQTQRHVELLSSACMQLGLDPDEMTPGRKIVQQNGKALAIAMKTALAASDPVAAELVACECVVLAETKDHFDWELIGECAKALSGEQQAALQAAYDAIEDEEDEHLYHTKGWCRELWMQALGLDAVLPPPEEKRHVKTAIQAAQTEQERKH
jgi:rubrerythrin